MRDTHFGMNGSARPHDISWSYDQSWKTDPRFRDEAEPQSSAKEPQGPLVIWYGDAEPEPPPYLIERLLPQTQTAILAGQFSAGKTFIAINIALAVMLGLEFAGHAVKRKGAVLWFAAEGASEVEIRLKAAALHATGEDQRGKLPFCRQAFSVPMLTQDGAQDRLMRIVEAAQADLSARFPDIELALIVVDTLNSAAGFADANDAAQAQKVMDLCRRVSDKSGALVLLVDHFGKLVETGIKGSMNKSDSADAILSALADKAQDGTISNRRMSVFKLRNGPSGETIPFKLVSVPVNEWGSTSCGVDWQPQSLSEKAAAQAQPPRPDWTGTGRLFRAAMVHALLDHGKEQRPFGFDTKALKAVEVQRVRAEFTARYPGETPDAKRKAFKRELASATAKNLIASREISGVDWLWFLKDADEHAKPDGRTDTDTPF